jgi:membrane protease YdiL (CAAX protease family)
VEPLPDPPPAPAPPAARKSALAFFAVLLALFLPGLLAQAALLPAGLAWTELFAFLLPALVATAGANLKVGPFLRLGWPGAAPVLLGAAVGGAGYVFAGALMALVQRVLPARWVEIFDPAQLFEGPRLERVLLAAAAVLLAPFCEEVAFRGYVQTAIALRRGAAAAIAGSAILFAVMHLDPVRFPALVVLGLVFGFLAWRAGSIWPAVAAHAANNGVTSALVLTLGVPDAAEAPPLAAIGFSLALGAAGLSLLLGAYAAATPRPPPADVAVALRDPADPSVAFSAARVPPAFAAAALAGLALLAALLAFGAGRPRERTRPAPAVEAAAPGSPRPGPAPVREGTAPPPRRPRPDGVPMLR